MTPFEVFVLIVSLTSLPLRTCDALYVKDIRLSFVLHSITPKARKGIRCIITCYVVKVPSLACPPPRILASFLLQAKYTQLAHQVNTLKMPDATPTSTDAPTEEATVPVYMKAYDLSHGLVSTISVPLLGFQLEAVWHTSIAIFGNEYLFGDGISYNDEGICESQTSAKLVRKVLLGHTNITKDVFHDYIESIREQFSSESYNLLKWNCNNFTNVVAEFLTGKGIPDEYVKFVDRIAQSPNGKMVLSIVENARENDRNAFVVPGQRT
ncbi:hypothetical protein X943_002671 [Babesia divergens]|uniref:PPPDE domain-containing protein n=1 Tax=Babesia divergens TaxID=32595 RepID=A0AAD9GHH2_BABDI|nr:hypothetical protein X943_002671 [Babesia divergens]